MFCELKQSKVGGQIPRAPARPLMEQLRDRVLPSQMLELRMRARRQRPVVLFRTS